MAELFEAPDTAELEKILRTRKRIKILGVLLVAMVAVRFMIKDPAPPKGPDHSNVPFRALPGVLKNVSPEDLKRLSAQQIAMLKEADRQALEGTANTALVKREYEVTPAPGESVATISKDARKFEYALREKTKPAPRPEMEPLDRSIKMLVLFNTGGYVKAENAERKNDSVQILVDRTISASVPRSAVQMIASNASEWFEPVPRGQKLVKPAKGITAIISSAAAQRITIEKEPDEI